jgi:hypothetical protein
MKIVLTNMSSVEQVEYEQTKGPLHPWAPRIDNRTGFSYCDICFSKRSLWILQRGLHPDFLIIEDDLPMATKVRHV